MTGSETIKRYGVKIRKGDINPITRVTYLYDAVGMTPAHMDFTTGKFDFGGWADIWFLKNNYPCMLKFDGTEDYRLNPNDYALKADGTESDIVNTDYAGNAMSAIPLVWLEQYEDEENEYIVVCEQQYNDNFHAYAHTRADGTIMNVNDNVNIALVGGFCLCGAYCGASHLFLNRAASGAAWFIGAALSCEKPSAA